MRIVCWVSCETGDGSPRMWLRLPVKTSGEGTWWEKRDRTEESRGGVGERKPGPSYTTPTLRHSASAKTLMWSRWKLSLDFSLLPGFLPAFGGFTAFPIVLQRRSWLESRKWLAETFTKDCLQNTTDVKSLWKEMDSYSPNVDALLSVDEWKDNLRNISG